jgi:hypothetical protein
MQTNNTDLYTPLIDSDHKSVIRKVLIVSAGLWAGVFTLLLIFAAIWINLGVNYRSGTSMCNTSCQFLINTTCQVNNCTGNHCAFIDVTCYLVMINLNLNYQGEIYSNTLYDGFISEVPSNCHEEVKCYYSNDGFGPSTFSSSPSLHRIKDPHYMRTGIILLGISIFILLVVIALALYARQG